MAVTAIWDIKGRFDKVIDYAVNPEKTVGLSAEGMASLHVIDDVIDYAADDMKTEECRYVSGINCDPDNAKEQFKFTKQHWKKTDGILAYHAIQSFAPGEVDADTAHKIGIKLAVELWGDRFEVIVATHLNVRHIHTHFIINSVSLMDGGKYNDCKRTYQKMREVSDRLCREFGLSVIDDPLSRGKSYGEWKAEKEGKPTLRNVIREAIDDAIRASVTIEQFLDNMDEMGFLIDQSNKYAKIKQVGNERFVRFKSLGEGYSIDDIYKRIARNRHIEYEDIPEQEPPQRIFENETEKPENMDFVAVNRCYCRALETTKERPKSNLRMYYLVRQDHSALRLYKDQLHLVTRHNLRSSDDIRAYKVKTMHDIDSLVKTRRELKNDLKRAERLGEPDRSEMTFKINFYIKQCSRQLSELRRDMTSCDEVLEHIDRMRENLMRIEQEKFNGEEVLRYEPIGGRGRSDRQGELERH